MMLKKFKFLALALALALLMPAGAQAYTRDWDETTPIDHTLNNLWPTYDRRAKTDVSERLTAQLYGFASGESTPGVKSLRFIDQVSNPSTVTDTMQLYGKAVGGKTELFFKDEDGNAVQVTNAGALNITIPTQTPTGAMLMWGTTSAPSGWLICDGSAVSRSTYSDLFAVIGTTFGTGDGSTTFNLPNFKSKNPMGYNSSDAPFDTMGETGGEQTHTQTINEMPAHTHAISLYSPNNGGSSGVPQNTPGPSDTSGTTASTGGGAAFNVLDPYLAINFIIKY